MPLPPTHTHLNERKKNSAESADASELIRDPHADKKAKAASNSQLLRIFWGYFYFYAEAWLYCRLSLGVYLRLSLAVRRFISFRSLFG